MSYEEFPREEEKEFKVIIDDKRYDRREIFSEPPAEQEPGPKPEESQPRQGEEGGKTEEATSESDEGSAESSERQFVSIFDLGVDGYLKQSLGVFFTFAQIYMGLIANPEKGILTPDYAKAKLAIDSFDFALEKIKGSLTKQEQAELTRVSRDLKMNFMNLISAPNPTGTQG